MESPAEVVKRYLQDAIAAEKNFESQLRSMSKEGDQPEVQRLFEQHAEETKRQHERLTARLEELGGTTSPLKSFMAHLAGFAPKAAQLGHDEAEKTTQNLLIAYSVENSEVAMYEALAVTCAAAGDTATERLAREIQQQERQTAQKVWTSIQSAASRAFEKLTTGRVRGAA